MLNTFRLMRGPMHHCIMGNGHMGTTTPHGQNDGQTQLKTLMRQWMQMARFQRL